jgi:hypothetical protein
MQGHHGGFLDALSPWPIDGWYFVPDDSRCEGYLATCKVEGRGWRKTRAEVLCNDAV